MKGFVDEPLQLSETKAVDQSMTLLQFIIKLIHVSTLVSHADRQW